MSSQWEIEESEEPRAHGFPPDFAERAAAAKALGHVLTCVLQIEVHKDSDIAFYASRTTEAALQQSLQAGTLGPDLLRVNVKKPGRLRLSDALAASDGVNIEPSAAQSHGDFPQNTRQPEEKTEANSPVFITTKQTNSPSLSQSLGEQSFQVAQYWLDIPVRFYPVEDRVVAAIGTDFVMIAGQGIAESLRERDAFFGLETPPEVFKWAKKRRGAREARSVGTDEAQTDEVQASPDYYISTTQETDALIRSAADGKRGDNWRNEIELGKRIWESDDTPHRIELWRGADGDGEVVAWDALEELTNDQNADFSLALFYIASVLCPPPGMQIERRGLGWVDINDVMDKIGWLREKPNAQKLAILRRKLWRFLVFAEEARVIGQRGGRYFDKVTGQEISTYVESPVWRITDERKPEAALSNTESGERIAPVAVKIAVSESFERIFSAPQFAQFMPLGELLGAIPPNKVAGDWARVIGLTLAKIWRCKPRETKAETLKITRREILTHFAPKTRSVTEILESSDPKRAVEYYREALGILLEAGLIAPEGDAARDQTPATLLARYSRKGWGQKWLGDLCQLQPGTKWEPIVNQRAQALPPLKPRALPAKRRTKTKKIAQ